MKLSPVLTLLAAIWSAALDCFGNCFLAASLALLAIPIPVFYATICFSSLKFLQPSSIAQKLSFFVSI